MINSRSIRSFYPLYLNVDTLVIAMDSKPEGKVLHDLLACKLEGCELLDARTYQERLAAIEAQLIELDSSQAAS